MKTFCVHIYERAHEIENIKAKNAKEAEHKAILNFCGKNVIVDDIVSHCEVMRQCECGYDNDTDNKKCDECGVKL